MPIRDTHYVTQYATYLLNTELTLTDIHIKKTKLVKRYNNKTLVFVELECAEQKVKVLKNKHLLKNMILRSLTSHPIYIHSVISRDSTRHENNIRKLIHVILGATDKIGVSHKGDIVTKKPLLPTPRNQQQHPSTTHHHAVSYVQQDCPVPSPKKQ